MSTSVTLNAVSYTIPAQGEGNWGTNVSNYLIALSTGVLQKAGGTFTLTADVDFGATYGLKSVYFKSRNTPSTAGIVRLGNNESVGWRNAANSANLELKVNASNKLEFDGQDIPTLDIGAADTVLQMNAGGTTWEFAKIANDNVDASAAIAYSKLNLATSIVNADVAVAAAIARSKLASGTASYVLINSGAGVMSEEQYLDRTRGGTGITSTATFPSSGTVTTDAGTSVLTNKDFDGGTASNNSRITVPKAAFATIDGLTDKEGTIAFDTDAKKLVVNDGSAWNAVGSGSSGRNYLSDWYDASKSESVGTSAATSTGNRTVAGNTDPTKWVTSDLTNLTFAKSTDTTLRQSYNYLINSGDANADFVESPLFTLDGRDLGKPISVSFDCAGVSASDDYQVCAVRYDSSGTYQEVITIAGTASATTPYSARIPVGTTSFNGFFVAGSTATDQYAIRFMKHAVNVDLRIDSLYVGPQSVVQGAAVTDETSTTLTPSAGFGSTTLGSYWVRRIGDKAHFRGYWKNGTAAASTASLALPTGYVIDSAKFASTTSVQLVGRATRIYTSAGPTTDPLVELFYDGSDTANVYFSYQSGSNVYTKVNGSSISSTSDGISFEFSVPIVGWSSNTTMANRAVERYFYTSESFDAAGSTTVEGIDGQATTNLTAARAKTLTIPNLQPTDRVALEFRYQNTSAWFDASQLAPLLLDAGGTGIAGSYISAATSATVVVTFTSKKWSALDGAPTTDWGTDLRWRVRVTSGGASVGYPIHADNIVVDHNTTQVTSAIESGTYTATLTNISNCSVLTFNKGNYLRVGKMVYVSIYATITTTAAAPTLSYFSITLPIASNLAVTGDVVGSGTRYRAGNTAKEAVYIEGDSGTDKALAYFGSTEVTAAGTTLNFMYEII